MLNMIDSTQLQKVRFSKKNELKLTEVELFSLFYFNSAAANVCDCFERPCKQIMNTLYTILTFHFKYQILCVCTLASPS